MLRHLAKGKEPLVAKEAGEAKEAKEIEPPWLSPMEMGKTKKRMDNKDDEKTEWNKCLVKAQKAKESCILAISNMEEAISNCHKAGRLTKAAREDYEDLMKDVQQQAETAEETSQAQGEPV